MTDLAALSATAQRDLVARGEAAPIDLIDAALARIETVQPALNCFAFVYAERARAEAAALPSEHRGPLHGLPVAFKDFTPTRGDVTTFGSRAYAGHVADFDPVIVRRFREAGAIIVGKTTTPEFAHAGHTTSPLWGTTRNPWNPERNPGGSSGGSGAAVTTGCVALAEGTDMGGSVRIPAAYCGCVGLKPSLGRIPMDILPTTFDGLSHFGPLARTVEDAALFLSVAEGPDLADIQSQRAPTPLPEHLSGDLRGRRIALSHDLGYYHVDDDVLANLDAVANTLRDAGATVETVDLGWTHELNMAWYTWWDVYQAAAFGHLLPGRRAELDPNIVEMMDAAQQTSGIQLKRLEYVRTEAWRKLANVFRDYDAMLCPTMTSVARTHEEALNANSHVGADGRFLAEDMTLVFNCVAQCPALSVPSGMSGGLPTAAQIVGRPWDDPTVLEIGRAIERRRPWPQWTPEVLSCGN